MKSYYSSHVGGLKLEKTIESCQSFVRGGYFKKYIINGNKATQDILKELEESGISYTSVYPDFEGLGKELEARFRNSE